MKWLFSLFGLDHASPVDETRRNILKTVVAAPLFIPILSGNPENIGRAHSDKENMIDFMTDVLTVTIMKDERESSAKYMVMSINGREVIAPLQQQVYIQRNYVELLVNTPHITWGDRMKMISTVRFPFTIHHDPAGEVGRAWLINAIQRSQV